MLKMNLFGGKDTMKGSSKEIKLFTWIFLKHIFSTILLLVEVFTQFLYDESYLIKHVLIVLVNRASSMV